MKKRKEKETKKKESRRKDLQTIIRMLALTLTKIQTFECLNGKQVAYHAWKETLSWLFDKSQCHKKTIRMQFIRYSGVPQGH